MSEYKDNLSCLRVFKYTDDNGLTQLLTELDPFLPWNITQNYEKNPHVSIGYERIPISELIETGKLVEVEDRDSLGRHVFRPQMHGNKDYTPLVVGRTYYFYSLDVSESLKKVKDYLGIIEFRYTSQTTWEYVLHYSTKRSKIEQTHKVRRFMHWNIDKVTSGELIPFNTLEDAIEAHDKELIEEIRYQPQPLGKYLIKAPIPVLTKEEEADLFVLNLSPYDLEIVRFIKSRKYKLPPKIEVPK